MGALITIDVHARDVVRYMVQSHVCSISDFEWTKQLRYYWEVKLPLRITAIWPPWCQFTHAYTFVPKNVEMSYVQLLSLRTYHYLLSGM